MKRQLKHKETGSVIYEAEAESMSDLVRMAITDGICLDDADLSEMESEDA